MLPVHDLLLFAGVISLAGVVLGFGVHMLAASLGITALFMAVPLAFELLKWAGAAYLLWMAWQAVQPGGTSPFDQTQPMPAASPRKLLAMGLLTSILNPKVAMFYLSIFPQFVNAAHGSVFWQSVTLGMVQITTSFSVNLLITLFAAHIALWFQGNPHWLRAQKWVMGTVLAGLALRLALEQRR